MSSTCVESEVLQRNSFLNTRPRKPIFFDSDFGVIGICFMLLSVERPPLSVSLLRKAACLAFSDNTLGYLDCVRNLNGY